MPLPLTRLYFVVSGRVQGVGFRWFALQAAEELGLSGWVRNRLDGAVEGEVQGPKAAVAVLLERVAGGPPSADVKSVKTEERAPRSGEQGFEIR